MFNRIKRTLSEAALRVVYALDEEAREAAEDAADEAAAQVVIAEMAKDPDYLVSGDGIWD